MTTAHNAAATAIRVQLAKINQSQVWLADQLGVSPYWLSRRMKGHTSFTIDDLDRIAKVFGLRDFTELFEVGELAA